MPGRRATGRKACWVGAGFTAGTAPLASPLRLSPATKASSGGGKVLHRDVGARAGIRNSRRKEGAWKFHPADGQTHVLTARMSTFWGQILKKYVSNGDILDNRHMDEGAVRPEGSEFHASHVRPLYLTRGSNLASSQGDQHSGISQSDILQPWERIRP